MLASSCSRSQGEDAGGGGFSIFFTTGFNNGQPEDIVPYLTATASAVDCTLSLGTPSTRSQSHRAPKPSRPSGNQRQQQHYYPLRLGFMSYEPKHTPASAADAVGVAALGAGAASGLNPGGDPLLVRRCAKCDTTSTPLWRNGPRGPKSLCNACGIRFKKEERRVASFAVTPPSISLPSSACALSSAAHREPLSQQQQQQCATGDVYERPCSYPATRQAAARSSPSLPFISSTSSRGTDDNRKVTALPNLPWWLNVPAGPQRTVEYTPGLLQDYT